MCPLLLNCMFWQAAKIFMNPCIDLFKPYSIKLVSFHREIVKNVQVYHSLVRTFVIYITSNADWFFLVRLPESLQWCYKSQYGISCPCMFLDARFVYVRSIFHKSDWIFCFWRSKKLCMKHWTVTSRQNLLRLKGWFEFWYIIILLFAESKTAIN